MINCKNPRPTEFTLKECGKFIRTEFEQNRNKWAAWLVDERHQLDIKPRTLCSNYAGNSDPLFSYLYIYTCIAINGLNKCFVLIAGMLAMAEYIYTEFKSVIEGELGFTWDNIEEYICGPLMERMRLTHQVL